MNTFVVNEINKRKSLMDMLPRDSINMHKITTGTNWQRMNTDGIIKNGSFSKSQSDVSQFND